MIFKSSVLIATVASALAQDCKKAYVTTNIAVEGDDHPENAIYEIDIETGETGEKLVLERPRTSALIWDALEGKMMCLSDIDQGGSTGPSELGYVDLNTGAFESIGELAVENEDYQKVQGLAIDDDGSLLTAQRERKGTGIQKLRLLKLNEDTGDVYEEYKYKNIPGDPGLTIEDLSFSPLDGKLYGTSPSDLDTILWTVDTKKKGDYKGYTQVGVLEWDGDSEGYVVPSIFFEPDGTLWGVARETGVPKQEQDNAKLVKILLNEDPPLVQKVKEDLDIKGKLQGAALMCDDLPMF